MAKLKRMTMQLKSDELRLHETLRPELENFLKDKNLLVWKRLMQMTGYDDPSLFEVCRGFKLTGLASTSDASPYGFLPTGATVEEDQWLQKSTGR